MSKGLTFDNFICSKYFTSANGTLKLLSVQEGDDGIYQCLISNDDDTAIATTYLWLGGENLSESWLSDVFVSNFIGCLFISVTRFEAHTTLSLF